MGRRRTRRIKQRGGGPSASPAFKHYIPEPAFPPGGSYKVGCPTRKNGYYYQYNCTGGTCPAKSTVGELSPGFFESRFPQGILHPYYKKPYNRSNNYTS